MNNLSRRRVLQVGTALGITGVLPFNTGTALDVLGRGPDGSHDPDPNERVGKDTVRVNPDETVRIAVQFGDFSGQFPWHCHVLEHEDHDMMRPFEVVRSDADETGENRKRGTQNLPFLDG